MSSHHYQHSRNMDKVPASLVWTVLTMIVCADALGSYASVLI